MGFSHGYTLYKASMNHYKTWSDFEKYFCDILKIELSQYLSYIFLLISSILWNEIFPILYKQL